MTCSKCLATEASREIEMVFADGVIAVHGLCDGCASSIDRYREAQGHFRVLLANGISRERANEIMIGRIDRGCYR